MEKIIIKPEGVYYAYFNEQADSWIEKDLIESELPISWYTPMTVEITGKVSIRRIIELFERYEDQLNFMYVKDLKTLTLKNIMEVLNQAKEADAIPILSVCLVWVGEYIEDGENEFIMVENALVGLDTDELEPDDDSDNVDEGVFQLTNFDFVQWSNVPLYLDDYLDFIKSSKPEIIFGGIHQWTLGDLFSCILAEISLNLFVSGLVTHPDIVIDQRNPTMGVEELFRYLDELDDFSSSM
jgi:hypothetical protein